MILGTLLYNSQRANFRLSTTLMRAYGSLAKRSLSGAPIPQGNALVQPTDNLTPIDESLTGISFTFRSEAAATTPTIPHLPIVDSLKNTNLAIQVSKLVKQEKPYLIATLHAFQTNASFFKFLIESLNFDPKKMHISDKFYSTSPSWGIFMRQLGVNYYEVPPPGILGGYDTTFSYSLKKMWKEVRWQIAQDKNPSPKIIALSDGGDLLKLTPADLRVMRMGGVEQTTAGLGKINEVLFPVADMASSAAKKFLESFLIAEDLFLHAKPYLAKESHPSTKTCGIIGNGTIGTALARYLIKLGFNVWVYDKSPHAFAKVRNNVIVCNSAKTLLENCDYAFGCTGGSVFAQNNIDSEQFILTREKDITFFSCSSSIVEWEDIIYAIRRNTDTGKGRLEIPPMSNVNYITLKDARVIVANMGYPINFNRQEETIPVKAIDLTRSLMTIGTMQAYIKARSPIADGYTVNQPERLPLDPQLQKYVVQQWLKNQPAHFFPEELVQQFNDENWIAENSQSKRDTNCPYPSFPESKSLS